MQSVSELTTRNKNRVNQLLQLEDIHFTELSPGSPGVKASEGLSEARNKLD
jgi:hypothetical protein